MSFGTEAFGTGGFGDYGPATVTGVSPAPGAITQTAPISFTVSDAVNGKLLAVYVFVEYASGLYEVAWDGERFSNTFIAGSSETPVYTSGRLTSQGFTLVRDGGWPEAPIINTRAITRSGHVS